MGHDKLIEELYLCSAECMACYNACEQENEKEMFEHCMKLDEECADICELTASLLERNSPNTDKFLKLCIELCNLCAAECEKHPHDHCRNCAAACRSCAVKCKNALPAFLNA